MKFTQAEWPSRGAHFGLVYYHARFVGLTNRCIIVYVFCTKVERLPVACWLTFAISLENKADRNISTETTVCDRDIWRVPLKDTGMMK